MSLDTAFDGSLFARDFLAAQGYVALAVDSFGSRGLGPCPNALVPQQPVCLDPHHGPRSRIQAVTIVAASATASRN